MNNQTNDTADRGAIKTPVRYNPDDALIRDADGYVLVEICSWRYNWRKQDPDSSLTPENGHACGQQIAAALNASATIAQLVEAAKAFIAEVPYDEECDKCFADYECEMCRLNVKLQAALEAAKEKHDDND